MDNILNFNWKYIASILGSSHSSIIGFISYEWIKQDPSAFFVLDAAPSPVTGGSRTGQVNSDLVLMQTIAEKREPKIIVEVETNQKEWETKQKNLLKYLESDKYKSSKGLLVITKIRGNEKNRETDYASEQQEKILVKIKNEIIELLRCNTLNVKGCIFA